MSESIAQTTRLNTRVIFALFLVHFTGDFYSAFLRPLLPALSDKLSLSLSEVGLVSGVFSLLAFVVQPLVGYLADRHQTRLFMLGGVFLVMTCMPFIGVAPSFGILLLLIALGSVGSSMFHPHAAGMVPVYSGAHKGFAMSCFWMGGAAAFGVGPFVAATWVDHYGLEALPWTSTFGWRDF
jgi:FSR family fosmidomycin resistance protein-like MFS transporter